MTLTKAEMMFAERMLHHVMKGLSPMEAASAVMDDDARIFNAFHNRSSSNYVPTFDESGESYRTREAEGDVMVKEISKRVYQELQA